MILRALAFALVSVLLAGAVIAVALAVGWLWTVAPMFLRSL
jgi:uncharacterized RDD family membrane protein YckC